MLCIESKESSDNTTEIRDIVYYKRKDSDKWKDPGKVIGKEDKQILVKRGGYYIRVHSCSLLIVDIIGSSISEGTPGNINTEEFMAGTEEKNSNNNLIYTSDDESEFYPIHKVGEVDNIQANEGSDMDQLANSLNDLTIHPCLTHSLQMKQLITTTSVIQND